MRKGIAWCLQHVVDPLLMAVGLTGFLLHVI